MKYFEYITASYVGVAVGWAIMMFGYILQVEPMLIGGIVVEGLGALAFLAFAIADVVSELWRWV